MKTLSVIKNAGTWEVTIDGEVMRLVKDARIEFDRDRWAMKATVILADPNGGADIIHTFYPTKVEAK